MVKILIVEDDEKDQQLIQKIINPFYFKYSETISVNFFTKCTSALLKEIADVSEKKIYILDICLHSKITGINLFLINAVFEIK